MKKTEFFSAPNNEEFGRDSMTKDRFKVVQTRVESYVVFLLQSIPSTTKAMPMKMTNYQNYSLIIKRESLNSVDSKIKKFINTK